MLDYIRIACAVPPVAVGDPVKNTADICRYIADADRQGCDLVVFPEMALTGYTCADLFLQESLLNASCSGLQAIADFSRDYPKVTAVVGLPIIIAGQIYNCGAVVSGGKIHGLVPKTYLPNYNEFYERRWFSSSEDLQKCHLTAADLGLRGDDPLPIGKDILFRIGDGTLLGVEICEDLWTPLPPSTMMSLNGAEVVVNLSASNETIGKRSYRRDLVKHQSSMCNCIYAYCSAGYTESTQDLVFCGHSLIAEAGYVLAENKEQIATDYMMVYDCDLGRVRSERKKNKSVRDAVSFYSRVEPMYAVNCNSAPLRSDGSLYVSEKQPFVPAAEEDSLQVCMSIFNIQAAGLKQRLTTVGANAVIGVSGGLDSTLALLAAVEAMRQLGRPATDVHAVILPWTDSHDHAIANAQQLAKDLGVSCKQIDVRATISSHLQNIGAEPQSEVAKQALARERTQILMDYAATVGGIVIGTGNLTELSLGWCTYSGDHMSMYSVNATIPRTLVYWMLNNLSVSPAFAHCTGSLKNILASSRQQIRSGTYPLYDFFLYHMMHYGFTPTKIYTMACRAFGADFDAKQIKECLIIFYERFFSQQFKRSCMPDGVKVGSVSLSPRGDWRMPSDATGRIWIAEAENL